MNPPTNVCLDNGCLSWSPVECANGYNIHYGLDYILTVHVVDGKHPNKHEVDYEGDIYVSAFFKDNDGASAHTPKTLAKSLKMILCPPDKNDAPDVVMENMTIQFQDDFNQGYLDDNKWNTAQPWGANTITNNEEQYYVDTQNPNNPNAVDPFSFGDSTLIITAAPQTPNSAINNGQSYTSGVITTKDNFEFTYGYIEFCMKHPCVADGYWAAGWLFNPFFTSDEIDAAEIVGNPAYGNLVQNWHALHSAQNNVLQSLDPNGFNSGSVSNCNGGFYDSNNGLTLPPINCGEFNTYGVLWEEGRIGWYVNGNLVNEVCDTELIPSGPMYIIANLAVGGVLGGTPDPNHFPAELEIDYIRVWQ